MEYVAIVSGLALLEYAVFGAFTGWARGKFEVAAPATSGHPEFERYFRVQQNTLEQLMIFLPSLWLFAYFVHPPVAAVVGLVFLLGRVLYFRGYVKSPERRGTGFLVGYLASAVLLIGGLIGAGIAVA